MNYSRKNNISQQKNDGQSDFLGITQSSGLDDQAALTLTGGTTVVYGQTLQLGTSGGSGTGAVTYAVTNGTGEATIDATGKLTPVKVGTVKVCQGCCLGGRKRHHQRHRREQVQPRRYLHPCAGGDLPLSCLRQPRSQR